MTENTNTPACPFCGGGYAQVIASDEVWSRRSARLRDLGLPGDLPGSPSLDVMRCSTCGNVQIFSRS